MTDKTMRRLSAAALLLGATMLLSRVIGFLREMFIAASFGATGLTDAFNNAFTFPDMLNYLVAGGTLSITFLPIYSRYLAENNEPEANRVLSIVMSVVLSVALVGTFALELCAGSLSAWYFHRLDASALLVCTRLTRILLPAQLFFIAGGLLNATLFARGKFAAAAFAPLFYNVGIIAGGFLLGPALGVEGLAWGALAGAFVGPFLIPAISAWRAGARVRVELAMHPGLKDWLKMSVPLMIGVSLVTADDWIIRYFASGNVGDVSRLNYAKRLIAVPIAIAGQAIGQASMPFFARLFAEGKQGELADTFVRTARGAMLVAILAAAWMIGMGEPLVDLLFRRGKFTGADVTPTATYLAVFAAAVPFWTLQGLTARVFYAARDTFTPMLAGTLVAIACLPVYWLGFRHGSALGLAIASGFGILAHTVALMLLASRVLPELRISRVITSGYSGVVVATVGSLAAWGTMRGIATSPFLACLIASLAFAGAVVLVSTALGMKEPVLLWRQLLRLRTRHNIRH